MKFKFDYLLVISWSLSLLLSSSNSSQRYEELSHRERKESQQSNIFEWTNNNAHSSPVSIAFVSESLITHNSPSYT